MPRATSPRGRPLFERALAIHEKALAPEHPYAATTLDNFGRLLHARGDLAGARPLFERALAICEKAFGPEHPNTIHVRDNLAKLKERVSKHLSVQSFRVSELLLRAAKAISRS